MLRRPIPSEGRPTTVAASCTCRRSLQSSPGFFFWSCPPMISALRELVDPLANLRSGHGEDPQIGDLWRRRSDFT
uniref:Uncharacterized protein n=1 Tax=Arundo donax TaxID=35708 RepID=A0A0A9ERV1_ARUDO